MTSWPSIAQLVARLQGEAGNDASRLGHSLTQWSELAERASLARCTRCGDLARITMRVAGSSPIQGAATQLRCTGVMQKS